MDGVAADAAPVLRLARRLRRGASGLAGRAWIRARQEAELAAPSAAPEQVAAFFTDDPPRRRARKLAAARAAQARPPDQAARSSARLWRDGDLDGWAESVIFGEFGGLLTQADHAYRADRLLYAGYLGAGDAGGGARRRRRLALAQARIAARSRGRWRRRFDAGPPALMNDPGSCSPRIQALGAPIAL